MAAVPNAPGVPALLTGFDTALSVAQFLTGDLIFGLGAFTGARWGVFLNGRSVISADTVLSVDYKQEWVIADYPLERGAFETYDKVATPYDARVRFISGGSEQNRQALLNSVAAIAGDRNLYDVVTPEAIYLSCNVRHYDYKRSSTQGLGTITVDLWLQQVRVTVGAPSNNTASPSGASQDNGGSVQATDATTAQETTAQDTPGSGSYNWFTGTTSPAL